MTQVRIKVLHPGLLISLQSVPMLGKAFYGFPAGGPMDTRAATLANCLVGNSKQATVLECNLLPPRLEFLDQVDIAITGADCGWQVNGHHLERNRVHSLAPTTSSPAPTPPTALAATSLLPACYSKWTLLRRKELSFWRSNPPRWSPF